MNVAGNQTLIESQFLSMLYHLHEQLSRVLQSIFVKSMST